MSWASRPTDHAVVCPPASEMAGAKTLPSWPASVSRSRPVVTSQTRSRPSSPAVISVCPSGDNDKPIRPSWRMAARSRRLPLDRSYNPMSPPPSSSASSPAATSTAQPPPPPGAGIAAVGWAESFGPPVKDHRFVVGGPESVVVRWVHETRVVHGQRGAVCVLPDIEDRRIRQRQVTDDRASRGIEDRRAAPVLVHGGDGAEVGREGEIRRVRRVDDGAGHRGAVDRTDLEGRSDRRRRGSRWNRRSQMC